MTTWALWLAGSDTLTFLDRLEDEYRQVGQRALPVPGNANSDLWYQSREKLPCPLQAKEDSEDSTKGPEVTRATDLFVRPDDGCEAAKYLLL